MLKVKVVILSTSIWIKQLIELIGDINKSYGAVKNDTLVDLLRATYDQFTTEEKEELYLLIKNEFETDYGIYLYLLSLILYITKDISITNTVIDYIIKNDLSLNDSLYYESQLLKVTCNYDNRRKLHNYNMLKMQRIFLNHVEKIKLDKRNKKSIVVITEQLLGTQHSPSKIVLDMIYYLQTIHKYHVHLFVCPTSIYKSWDTWCNYFYFNHIEELNGRTHFAYKDITIDCCQIPLKQENYELINQEIDYIMSLEPYFIYSLGCSNAIADMFSKITTVVAQSMDTELPCQDAQILLKLWKNNEKNSNIEHQLTKKQRVIPYQFFYLLEDSGSRLSRKDLNLQDNQYLIAIVGNRLDDEITKEFSTKIRTIIDEYDHVSFVFVGDYNKCDDYFKDLISKNRIYPLGYQDNLLSVYSCFNLYWNPPRKGGGISALMALKGGLPVVTLPDCDVAYHVGREFICQNNQEEINTIKRYINDVEFNVMMKQKSYERFQKLEDCNMNNLDELVRNIEKTINEMEIENND